MTPMKKELCVGLYTYPVKETPSSVDTFVYAFIFCGVYS